MTRSLRVAVNLLWLAPGRVGGSEQYLVRQLAGLPSDGGVTPTLFVQHSFASAHRELADRFETRPLPLRRDWRGARIVAEHTWLAAGAGGHDVVHHGGGTTPLIGPRPIVLTIHDLQYRTFPHYFSPARRAYLRAMMPRAVRRATVVATPSQFVRGEVIDAFGVAPERVVVVPHGVPALTLPSEARRQAASTEFDLGERPYVIYPAITHPHKGHRVLVEMLRHDRDLLLVLPGGEGPAEGDLRRATAAAGVEDRVVRVGRVDDVTRDALVAGAEALVFPSQFEGFGAPLVEAMALNVPIVCSAHPAVREVVGDAAIIVESGSGEEWAAAVRRAISERPRLVAAADQRRQQYTIERAGVGLMAAYRLAVNGGAR